jgi:CheY-like chemotaxis protein
VISERLVDLMGGEISVSSVEGEGTSFSFSVQCKVGTQSSKTYINNNLVGCEGKRILLVDDNKTNLRILKTQLAHWNLFSFTAMSGKEGLIILENDPDFDLIISDMQMPEMSGVEFSQQVKLKHPGIPIVLLSSIGDETKKNYLDLFSAILTKPIKQQQLLKVVQTELKRVKPILVVEQKPTGTLSEEFAQNFPLDILVAEDNLINQKLILRILKKLGYDAEMANHGKEALDRLSEKDYDVILMDMQMPELDGLETTRHIRLNNKHQPVIIALTANALYEDKDRCYEAGMDDYLSKPINMEELLSALKKAAEVTLA